MTLVVRRAAVDEIMPLRHAVLRPGYPPEASHYAQDDVAVHVGAWEEATLVGWATGVAGLGVGPPVVADAWRLRGMAMDTSLQVSGVGTQVLDEAVSAASEA